MLRCCWPRLLYPENRTLGGSHLCMGRRSTCDRSKRMFRGFRDCLRITGFWPTAFSHVGKFPETGGGSPHKGVLAAFRLALMFSPPLITLHLME